jgi:exocyst complex component 7
VIGDVLSTLIATLTTLSKSHKRPAISAIFILNNMSYLRYHLLSEPETPIDELLSEKSQSELNSAFRTAKAAYFDTNYMSLVSCLSDDKERAKMNPKDKLMKFYETLEEVGERHRFAKVMGEDEDGRDKLEEEATRLVIPMLQRFIQKHRDKEFSKSESDDSSYQGTTLSNSEPKRSTETYDLCPLPACLARF